MTASSSAVTLALEHPGSHPPDDLAPLLIDVLQDQLLDREPLAFSREP